VKSSSGEKMMDGVSLHQGPTQSQIRKVKELIMVVARCFYTEVCITSFWFRR